MFSHLSSRFWHWPGARHVVAFIGLFLVLVTEPLLAQDSNGYLWPTDASDFLTSAFGEYRPRRFHTGVDVKTWGKIGYKCFAVRPGYVWRISVSPYGYGKAIYLKLDSGEVAVYAHLSRFNDRIQEVVEGEQRRRGQYRINLFLKPGVLPVARGDVIAYTGQTGIGAPHLHFEIRDAANRPINPLLKGYRIPDVISPIVTKVSFSPLDGSSEVNGDYKPVVVVPQWVRPGEYIIKEPISVWGNVGLAVSAYDKSLETSNRFGVYQLRLLVDEIVRFEYQYDRLSFPNNPMVELERDYRLSRRKLGRFYKLYKDRHNLRSNYQPNETWGGVLHSASLSAAPNLLSKSGLEPGQQNQPFRAGCLLPGEHRIRIEIADIFGNVSTVSGRVKVGSAFDIHPLIREDENGDLTLADVVTFDLEQLKELDVSVLIRSRWQEIPFDWPSRFDSLREKGGGSSDLEWAEPPEPLPLSNQTGFRPVILKISGRDQFEVSSYPFYYVRSGSVEHSPPPQLTVTYDFYDDYARLEVQTKHILRGVPGITLYPGRSGAREIQMHQVDLKRFIGRIALDQLQGTEHPLAITVETLNGEQFSVYEMFLAEEVKPASPDRIVSDDNKFWVSFGRNSLYRTIYTRIHIDNAKVIPDLDAVGPIYTVEPKDALMKKGALVNIQYADSTRKPDKLGVYYESRPGRWVFIDNQHDISSNSISAKVLSFEDFALIRDEEPPEVTHIRPGNNARLRNKMPLISVRVRDRLSGIKSEKDLEIRLDGKRVIAEYDPERRKVTYQVKAPLASGQHELMVMALDKCRNVTIKKSQFWIE